MLVTAENTEDQDLLGQTWLEVGRRTSAGDSDTDTAHLAVTSVAEAAVHRETALTTSLDNDNNVLISALVNAQTDV